jgi:hypothetical protein
MAADIFTQLTPLIVFVLYAALFGIIVAATRTFASALFDTKRAAGTAASSLNIKVQDGDITEDSSPLLRGMGGPGFLLVDEHSAAVLEKFGHFTRVVGGGFKILERYERVRGAVDLRRHLRKGTSKVYTRDGLPVEYDVEMEFRILPAPDAPNPPPSAKHNAGAKPSQPDLLHPYSFSPAAVWQAVYPLAVQENGETQDWGNFLLRLCFAEIDGYIASHPFDELTATPVEPGMNTRTEMSIRRRIQRQAETAAAAALGKNGAELLALRLSSFRFEGADAEGIMDQRFDNWKTYWANEALKFRKDGEKEAFKAREKGRAEAQRAMLILMAQSLRDMANRHTDADQVLWLRVIESLEHMALDSTSYRFVPQEIISLIQSFKNAGPRMENTVPQQQPALPLPEEN